MNAEQLAELNALAEKGGGEVRIAKQHEGRQAICTGAY